MSVCPARRLEDGSPGGSLDDVHSDWVAGRPAGGQVNTSMRSSSDCVSWVMRTTGNCGRHYIHTRCSRLHLCGNVHMVQSIYEIDALLIPIDAVRPDGWSGRWTRAVSV